MKWSLVTYTVMKNYVMGNWELTFISLYPDTISLGDCGTPWDFND